MNKLIFVIVIFPVIFNYYCESKIIKTSANLYSEVKIEIRKSMFECSKKDTDVPEFIHMMKDGTWKEDKEFKMYLHCVYLSSGYSNNDGRVNIDNTSSVYPNPVLMKKIFTDCDKEATLSPVDPVETTFISFRCYQERVPYFIDFDSGYDDNISE